MRLIDRRHLKKGEDKYVYSPAEAITHVKWALDRYQKIEGLAELRRGLMINHDHYVWQHIERGEWLLIKREARTFDWKHFEKQAFDQRVMALMENPPPQIEPPKWIFRANDCVTGEPILSHDYHCKFDGESTSRRTDTQGFGTLPVLSKHEKIWMELSHSYR